MLKNDWLELEEKTLRLEMIGSRKRQIPLKGARPMVFFFLIALGLLSSFSSVYAQGRGIWGDTWNCRSCGYENYVGIETCPVCGKPRHSK